MEFDLKIHFPGIAARERSKRSHYWLVIASQAVFSGFGTPLWTSIEINHQKHNSGLIWARSKAVRSQEKVNSF
jgi:hypothetical protein